MNLVAEGLTRDVVERAGGQIDERTLATLRAHMDSLGLVVELVRDKRQLTTFFIRELSGCTIGSSRSTPSLEEGLTEALAKLLKHV